MSSTNTVLPSHTSLRRNPMLGDSQSILTVGNGVGTMSRSLIVREGSAQVSIDPGSCAADSVTFRPVVGGIKLAHGSQIVLPEPATQHTPLEHFASVGGRIEQTVLEYNARTGRPQYAIYTSDVEPNALNLATQTFTVQNYETGTARVWKMNPGDLLSPNMPYNAWSESMVSQTTNGKPGTILAQAMNLPFSKSTEVVYNLTQQVPGQPGTYLAETTSSAWVVCNSPSMAKGRFSGEIRLDFTPAPSSSRYRPVAEGMSYNKAASFIASDDVESAPEAISPPGMQVWELGQVHVSSWMSPIYFDVSNKTGLPKTVAVQQKIDMPAVSFSSETGESVSNGLKPSSTWLPSKLADGQFLPGGTALSINIFDGRVLSTPATGHVSGRYQVGGYQAELYQGQLNTMSADLMTKTAVTVKGELTAYENPEKYNPTHWSINTLDLMFSGKLCTQQVGKDGEQYPVKFVADLPSNVVDGTISPGDLQLPEGIIGTVSVADNQVTVMLNVPSVANGASKDIEFSMPCALQVKMDHHIEE